MIHKYNPSYITQQNQIIYLTLSKFTQMNFKAHRNLIETNANFLSRSLESKCREDDEDHQKSPRYKRSHHGAAGSLAKVTELLANRKPVRAWIPVVRQINYRCGSWCRHHSEAHHRLDQNNRIWIYIEIYMICANKLLSFFSIQSKTNWQ